MEIVRAATREEGMRKMRDMDLTAMLVIPKGFGQAILDGKRTELELLKNPAQRFMPVVAQQGLEVAALYASIAERLIAADREKLVPLLEGKGWENAAGVGITLTALYGRVRAADDLLLPPIIEVKASKEGAAEGNGFDFIGWMYPGILMMGVLFVGSQQMSDLIRERDAGTLRRLGAAPLTPWQILIAKILSVTVIAIITEVILILAGIVGFGVRWGSPAPLALVVLLIALAVTGFSALLWSLVRTERQGDAYGGIVIMVMSMLGGAFVPPQVLPQFVRPFSSFTINHWGNEALRTLTAGGGWREVAPYMAALAGLGIVFTTLGAARMAWRQAKGTL
jgi:ABC-2 type transport system permease protein